MKPLHLGCGNIHLDGWVNIDRRYQPGVDKVDNIGILQHCETTDTIYSCHSIDHFDRWTYKNVLKRWFDLLNPGGRLYLSTPNFEWVVLNYQRTGDLRSMIGQLYAGQDYADNVRHWIWDLEMARADLLSVGFISVDLFEPFADDASKLVDSQGNKRSLNVVATKP